VEEEPAGRGRHVDLNGQAAKLDPAAPPIRHEIDQPLHRAPQSIQFSDDQHITAPEMGQGLAQPGALGLRGRGLVGEEAFAPGLLQGVELEGELLLIRRDPGVTDPHAAPPVNFLETHRIRTLAGGRFLEWFWRSGMP
jgi:hypothetical protein